MERLFKFTKTN